MLSTCVQFDQIPLNLMGMAVWIWANVTRGSRVRPSPYKHTMYI